jgi:predicted nucleic-acid-binding protein
VEIIDANVLLRHFTGQPTDQARRATSCLRKAPPRSLLLLDVQVAELVYVLERLYLTPRAEIATLLGAALGLAAVVVDDEPTLRRGLALYEQQRMHWADAYMISSAEGRGIASVVSFDRFDAKLKGLTVSRREP